MGGHERRIALSKVPRKNQVAGKIKAVHEKPGCVKIIERVVIGRMAAFGGYKDNCVVQAARLDRARQSQLHVFQEGPGISVVLGQGRA